MDFAKIRGRSVGFISVIVFEDHRVELNEEARSAGHPQSALLVVGMDVNVPPKISCITAGLVLLCTARLHGSVSSVTLGI